MDKTATAAASARGGINGKEASATSSCASAVEATSSNGSLKESTNAVTKAAGGATATGVGAAGGEAAVAHSGMKAPTSVAASSSASSATAAWIADRGESTAATSSSASRSADVVLRGYSGYNTRWAARVAGRAVASIAGPVSAVTVFFGANDAALPDRACALQHVPIAEYKDNLRAICALLKKRWPSVVVILITPPPVDEDGRLRYPYAHDFSGLPERTNAAAGLYARACLEVARLCGLRAIDIWSRMQRFAGWEKSFLRDGLHLTPRGNRVLFEEVVFALKDANLSLEALPADLPLFGDMDPDNPAKSFEDQGE